MMNTKPNTPTRKPTMRRYKHNPKHELFLVLPEEVHELLEMFRCNHLDKDQSGTALMTYLHLRRDGLGHWDATCEIARQFHPPYTERQLEILAKAKPVHD